MRIAITADLHWGHNRLGDDATQLLLQHLQQQPPDLLLLGGEVSQTPSRKLVSLTEAHEEAERAYLVQVLTATRGNISRAAALAGRYRTDLYKLLRKHALDPAAFKDDRTTK